MRVSFSPLFAFSLFRSVSRFPIDASLFSTRSSLLLLTKKFSVDHCVLTVWADFRKELTRVVVGTRFA